MRESLLTLSEVAARMSCSVATVKRRVRSGDLPAMRDGRLVRVRETDLERYVAERIAVPVGRAHAGFVPGRRLRPGDRLWD